MYWLASGGHKDAGTKQFMRESCGRRALLELSLNVLQGAIVINGVLEPVVQVLEKAGDFWGLASSGRPSAQNTVLPWME